jgi:hypothetical protein
MMVMSMMLLNKNPAGVVIILWIESCIRALYIEVFECARSTWPEKLVVEFTSGGGVQT